MSNTPQIRFAGFTDAWEQRKVGELTVESSEYTTLEAGFPLLTSSRNGLMYQNEYRGKQTTDSTETMFSIVPLGACTYRHMSDDDVFHLNVNRLEKGLVSREYPVFYASDDNNLDFIVQQINSSAEFRSFCAEQKKGGTRTRLYYKNLCEFQMLIPNTEEQEKIATFLLTLDTLITLHQRKCDALQKFKKSMLQKMFPQNGESVPEIRFAGFTDAWEQRKLEEVITVGNGMDYKHLSEGDIPVYGTGGYMLNVDKALSYDKDAIGIGRKGTIDKPYVLKAPFWTVDTLFYCIPKEDYSLDFVYCIFQNVNWKEKDESTGVPSLSKVNINSTDVKVPTLAEQEKIGDYFRNLDNLITLHQRKLETLQKMKKSLLQKMFV